MRPRFQGVAAAAATMATVCAGIGLAIVRDANHDDDARDAVRSMQTELDRQTERMLVMNPDDTVPPMIDASWFGGEIPRNPLLSEDRPWIDIAPYEDRHLEHPRDPVAKDDHAAMFWYNPHLGIVRARVCPLDTAEETQALYDVVNGSVAPTVREYDVRVTAAGQ